MTIDWNESLAIGVDVIDNQHREIFGKLSELLGAMSQGKGKKEVEKILAFLSDYVKDHFVLEEGLMTEHKYSYEDTSRMKVDHDRLMKNFIHIKKKYETGGATLHLVVEIQQNLCDWLSNHIWEEDRKLGTFLKTKGASQL